MQPATRSCWCTLTAGIRLTRSFPELAGYRVDAIVSALAVLSPEAADELAKFKIQVVSFNTPVKNEWVTSISSDNEHAGTVIADHFFARGARSFGYVTGPAGSPASEDRLKGFCDRLALHGCDKLMIVAGDFHYESGYEAALSLVSDARPEAIFCANDLLAMGAIDAIRSRTPLRVPEDVIVAGFDDIPMAGWAAYDLTTFAQDAPRMVSETIRVLQTAEETRAPFGEAHIILPARLVERGSTRRQLRKTH